MLTTFFQTVQQQVESIEEFSRPHPLSTEAAVASLKRYIPDPQHRIRLSDLIEDTVERVVKVTSGEAFSVEDAPEPTTKSVTARVRGYDAACSTLLAMAMTGGYWAEEEHYPVWQRALERLGSTPLSDSSNFWPELQRYPATLLLYALGLGAVEADLDAGRLRFLGRHVRNHDPQRTSGGCARRRILPPFRLFSYGGQADTQILEGMDKSYVPLNDWMHDDNIAAICRTHHPRQKSVHLGFRQTRNTNGAELRPS